MQPDSASSYPTLRRDVHQALRNWHAVDEEVGLFSYRYLYRRLQREGVGNARRVTNQLLLQAIEALAATHETEARLIQARFLDHEPIHRLANRLNIADSKVYVAPLKERAILEFLVKNPRIRHTYTDVHPERLER